MTLQDKRRPPIQVVGAAIVRDGCVLMALRSATMSSPGLWEFPGGKVERGESAAAALRREIMEELGASVVVGEEVLPLDGEAPEAGAICLRVFRCELVAGTPRPREHAQLRWVSPRDLPALELAEADVPFAVALADAPAD
jgi:8-oxo-dGTP diphosphatase